MSADAAQPAEQPPAQPPGERWALPIEKVAAQLAGYTWVEQRLFEILGSWAMHEEHAPAAVLFDMLSQQHAWHAQLFAERIPVVPGAPGGGARDGAPRAPRPELDTAFDELAAAGNSQARLGAIARVVLPRMLTGYRVHLGAAAPIADAPVVRALRLVISDEIEGLLECEQLLESLPGPLPALGGLEASLTPAGGVGVVGWPPPGVSLAN